MKNNKQKDLSTVKLSESWQPYLLEPENAGLLRHLFVTIHPGQLTEFYKSTFKTPHDPKGTILLGVSPSKTRAENIIEGLETLCESLPIFVKAVVEFWLDAVFADSEKSSIDIDRDKPEFHIVVAALSLRSPVADAPSWDYVATLATKLLAEKNERHVETDLASKLEQLAKENEKVKRKLSSEEKKTKKLRKNLTKLEAKYGKLEQHHAQSKAERDKVKKRLQASENELGHLKKAHAKTLGLEERVLELDMQLKRSQQKEADSVAKVDALEASLTSLESEAAALRKQRGEHNYHFDFGDTPADYNQSLEHYQAALNRLRILESQAEVINSKRYMRNYSVILRRYEYILGRLDKGTYDHMSMNWRKAELSAMNNVLSFALEAELNQIPVGLDDESFGKALVIDYDLLGEESIERFKVLLSLYESYLKGTSEEVLLQKTNLAALKGEPEGLLLLGLESFLNDCLKLPIRRYLNLSSFKHESLIMALGQAVRAAA